MPYILLVAGLLIGGYALYHFLRKASKDQAQKVLLTLAIGLMLVMIFVMILTGKLPIAAILTAVLIPLCVQLYRVFNRGE
jgi:Kef-type K+ transport system membrane component KefB